MSGQWWQSKSWKIAHRLHDRPTEEFLGARYWTTLCGKRVRADRITEGERGDLPRESCATCRERRQTP